MSTLTKVFVILLVVFSIAFTTMAVSIVAQQTNWRATAEKYGEHARIADTNLRNLIAANAAELATAQDAVQTQAQRAAEMERQLQSARNEVAQLTSDLTRLSAEKSSAESMSRGLLAQLKVAEDARNEYRKQRDDLEQSDIELQRRNIDLNDRVNEQTARIVVLQQEKRQYEQQFNVLREENQRLAAESRRVSSGIVMEDPSGAAMSNVQAMNPVAVTPIRGQVLELSDNMVSISVGAADGVRKDMIFVIYRGDEYVADMKVSLVEPNRSAGRIIRSSSQPRVGDQVGDAVRFSPSRG